MKRDMLRAEIMHGTRGKEGWRTPVFDAFFGDLRDPPMRGDAEKEGWKHGNMDEKRR